MVGGVGGGVLGMLNGTRLRSSTASALLSWEGRLQARCVWFGLRKNRTSFQRFDPDCAELKRSICTAQIEVTGSNNAWLPLYIIFCKYQIPGEEGEEVASSSTRNYPN